MSEIITQGYGGEAAVAETGSPEQVIQGQVLPVLEKLEDAVKNAMDELGAKGLSFKAAHTRLLETINKVLREDPEYYLLDMARMSPEMKIVIGLERRESERSQLVRT